MLVFIDESGDPGLKLDSGSTDYFIVTLVAFEDSEEALAADQRIQLLKRELGFKGEFEFHFNKVKGAYREAFLSAIANYDFFYFSIVINKAKLQGPGFKFKESFYKLLAVWFSRTPSRIWTMRQWLLTGAAVGNFAVSLEAICANGLMIRKVTPVLSEK